ncbi:MAG: hypothetical protein KDK90_06740 [Leptospiraceae bacterium]|nr:hypothetical protein [Leptospiraceae bacterium]
MSVHVFGIRHHGPGSAKSLLAHLEHLKPDALLIEGPVEAKPLISFSKDSSMKPPVAILCYVPENPSMAFFYPFAKFSPEYQAILYGLENKISIDFMDLPLANRFALQNKETQVEETSEKQSLTEDETISIDPIYYLAQIAGYEDSELWWEHTFEQRQNHEKCFDAIREAMVSLREHLPKEKNEVEILREASMRNIIRDTEKRDFQKIAVVCGAWHVPGIMEAGGNSSKHDNDLLKKLPKAKVESTWVPWTYQKLTFASGYGAGIVSPGWYDHLWEQRKNPKDTAMIWMAKVASFLRAKNMDTSVAHIIEAVRLSEMLAVLRNIPSPGLQELNEATRSVISLGDDVLLRLIHKELIVSNRMGKVPKKVPKIPLEHDIEKLEKKLKLKREVDAKEHNLDLRNETHLQRSIMLHRLEVLGIRRGTKERIRQKGTAREKWNLQWQPELSIKIIEMGVWGNTLKDASTNYINDTAKSSTSVSHLSELLDTVILASLESTIQNLITTIDHLSSVSGDIQELMNSIPPLAEIVQYNNVNVRKTDTTLIANLVEKLVIRISIGLPNACYSLDEDAAQNMFENIQKVNNSIKLLNKEEFTLSWTDSLLQISKSETINGLIKGFVSRLLSDWKIFQEEAVASQLSLALSVGNESSYSAAWLEGFLRGRGMILIMDDTLWNILDKWIMELPSEMFQELLPLIRRTFSSFEIGERRRIGEKVVGTGLRPVPAGETNGEGNLEIDDTRGSKALPIIAKLLGI